MLKIGENIKKLRQDSEYTQEQLAEIIGVSPQAVSRWENSVTYPDITLLPLLANLFDVTLDDLMGMENIKSERQFESFRVKYSENNSKGLIYENILLLREELKVRPNNYQLQYELINKLFFCQRKNGEDLSEEEIKSNLTEAVGIGERLLLRCTDPMITNAVIKDMCYIYSRMGESGKAIEYAEKLPSFWCSSTAVLGDIYEDAEKRKEHIGVSIIAYVEALYLNLRNLADLEYKDRTLSAEDRIAMLQKAVSFFEIVFDDKDYFYDSAYVSDCHRCIAAMAMLNGQHELALSSLEKAAEYAAMFDTLPEKAQHTSLIVSRVKFDLHETAKNFEFTKCGELYGKMQWDRYDAVRSDKRFTAILEKIKGYMN